MLRSLSDARIIKRGSCIAGIDLYLSVGQMRVFLRLTDEKYFLSFFCSTPSILCIEMVSLLFFSIYPTHLAITEQDDNILSSCSYHTGWIIIFDITTKKKKKRVRVGIPDILSSPPPSSFPPFFLSFRVVYF
jgi:hypothetical protein